MRAAHVVVGVGLGLALGFALGGCLDTYDRCGAARPGDALDCPMPGYVDRAFSIAVPPTWDGVAPLPVVLLIHGGGGRRDSAEKITCPGGDERDPACFVPKALARGYAVVRPDGTGTRPTRNIRTWNAGGGANGFQCTSGGACRAGVDDVAYFRALLDEVGRVVPIDARRVFATGLSNGGAMSHRLACELGDRLAAVAPMSGANQFEAAGGACPTALPVLHIHGTADPCWPYAGGGASCIDSGAGIKENVDDTMERWRVRDGCGATYVDTPIADADPTDGTTAVHRRWSGCAQAVELIKIDGGGHAWPGGDQYFGADTIGVVSRDFSATDAILDFFDAHARP